MPNTPAANSLQPRQNTSIKRAKTLAILSKNVGDGKYADGLITNKDVADAMVEAGYSEETAISHPERITQTTEFRDAMKRAGITADMLVAPIKDALEATRPDPYGPGNLTDHSTRLKAAALGHKLYGGDQQPQQPQGNTYNFIGVVAKEKEEFGI